MLYTYVPSLVKCRVFGVELKGLSKDTLVTIERIDPVNSFRKAQDGSQIAYFDAFARYRVIIHLEQVSQSNEFLHTVFKLHQKVGGHLKIPLSVSEGSKYGGTQFTAFDCFFETEPVAEFTSESLPREWSFICNSASYSLKGTESARTITTALRETIRMIELSELAGIDLSNIEGLIDKGIDEAQSRLKNLF